MRNAFIKTLCEIAKADDRIFLLCGDLGYSVLEQFADQFPDRFLNVGIAEQNMMQVAAGLALEGYEVFAYSIGNFPTLRCMEQIRYDICYHNLNVKVVAVGAGYAYGPLGVSHHTTEDIGMLRTLPNMVVSAPGDQLEADQVTRLLAQHQGPGYLRLNKAGERPVHQRLHYDELGTLIPVLQGSRTAVITTGAVLADVVQQVQSSALDYAVYSAPVITEMERDQLAELARNYDEIITVEEHQLNAGFGSAVIEQLSDMYAAGIIGRYPKVRRIAIPGVFQGYAGTQEYLRARAGISLF